MLFCTCRYPHLWVPAFLFTLCKEKLMKRHLNTSYRLVWNHITGTLVVASELARSRGKRAGVAVALSLAAVTSAPALAADTVVQAGETVNDGTLTNHDNQIVFGTANGMTISTGLEYGPDNEANTGGQWIQNGGIANNTTVTGGGLQRVNAGGSVSDTVISAGGGQSLQGQAVNTTLNGGEQWVHEGGIATGTVINEKGWQAVKSGAVATDTVVNTGAEGGPDAENGDTGQFVRGNAVRTTINENGRQIVAAEGTEVTINGTVNLTSVTDVEFDGIAFNVGSSAKPAFIVNTSSDVAFVNNCIFTKDGNTPSDVAISVNGDAGNITVADCVFNNFVTAIYSDLSRGKIIGNTINGYGGIYILSNNSIANDATEPINYPDLKVSGNKAGYDISSYDHTATDTAWDNTLRFAVTDATTELSDAVKKFASDLKTANPDMNVAVIYEGEYPNIPVLWANNEDYSQGE